MLTGLIYRSPKRKSVVYPLKDCYLLIPGLLGFLMFYVIPFAVSAYHAVVESAFRPTFVGLKNFGTVLQNAYYQLALKNSMILAVSLPLCLIVVAMLLALIMRRNPLVRPLQSMFLFPAFVPSSAIASIWSLLFSKQNHLVVLLNYSGGMINNSFNGEWLSLFTLAVWKNLGMILVLVMGAFLTLDEELEQAAALDGANSVKRFFCIVFPQLKPMLMFVLVYAIMCSMRLFREAYLLYGAYPREPVYLVQHYMNNHFSKLNYQNLSSGAILLASIIAIVMLPLLKMMRHYSEEIE